MNNFYNFLESKLNESNDEFGFIISFMSNFDMTALLVFADWLGDHDDPREELVRVAAKHHLFPYTQSIRIATNLGIINCKIGSDESGLTWFNTNKSTYFLSADDNKIYKAVNSTTQDGALKTQEVDINQMPKNDLVNIFWSILGYGIYLKSS